MADELHGPGPTIKLKTATFEPVDADVEAKAIESSSHIKHALQKKPSRRQSLLRQRKSKQARIVDPGPQHSAAKHAIYLGSYATRASDHGRHVSRSSLATPRSSTSHLQLEHLLPNVDVDLETYGVEELRDGFFDASFYRPLSQNSEDLKEKALLTLPDVFKQKFHPLSLRRFLPQQVVEVGSFFHKISTSRAGVKLFKSFLGFFIAYVICLVPASRDWLGRYNYIIVVSAIINHPGRAVGSQLDGTLLTILGTIAGLGWGSLALYVSTSTSTARSGYGGVLASFLVIFAVLIGWLRCVFIRLYQAVLSAGVAVCYICLADTSQSVGWVKVFQYGIPWVLGQAICLIVSILVFPEAGSRALAVSLHDSLKTVQEGLVYPREDSPALRRKLAHHFVRISTAVRDFTIEFTFSRFCTDDIPMLRNLIQSVIRSILAIQPDTALFEKDDTMSADDQNSEKHTQEIGCIPLNASRTCRLIRNRLQRPAREMINAMVDCVSEADSCILKLGGQAKSKPHSWSLQLCLDHLRLAKEAFDLADAALIAEPALPATYNKIPEVVELLLFLHPLRQAADKVQLFTAKVMDMQGHDRGWRIRSPSYPLRKGLSRSNAQVRHDRGGLTAGFYFRSKRQLDRTMADLSSAAYIPASRHALGNREEEKETVMGEYQQEQEIASGKVEGVSKMAILRYRSWEALHRLQGFESRFAFKVALVTVLLSIPAWLPQSRTWWNEYESWWTVVTVWTMMHPRVGGTFQDMAARTFCAALGALWGGLTYAADNGNPYVMAVLASIYMIPMLYRFTQSSHPRSGIVGCISFIVVSLGAYTNNAEPSIVTFAWTRGLAFIVGVVAALVTNWILWPFIARHELRKSLSAMMLHSAILYRGVIAKYIYYNPGSEPGLEDIARSEMVEGRLREGFVRMRQLMELTRHEMRLRAPFDPLPYSALIASCESLFEHLVQVRQSSLYFQPSMRHADPEELEALIGPRRDATAVILMNLYALATALRADRAVPRYLPSAAVARRRLLDKMDEVEEERAQRIQRAKPGELEEKLREDGLDGGGGKGKAKVDEKDKGRRWADVYQYAFSTALTAIVEELQELQKFTKEICGEVSWEGVEEVDDGLGER